MNINSIKLIENQLNSKNLIIGSKICYFDNTSSTMTIAKEIAVQGCQDGLVIVASSQTSGRGRLGKNWSSPEGGLWMSLIVHPSISTHLIPLITLAAGVCVCKTIHKLYHITPGLKWPNDVVVNSKKVCGILTEGSIDANTVKFAVLGIGVNLNFSIDLLPDELKERTTTLLYETNLHIKPEHFLLELLIELNSIYRQLNNNFSQIVNEWKKYSITIGKEVNAIYNNKVIHGTAKDITLEGNLIIRLENGEEISVCSGEVTLRGKNNSYI